MSSPIPDNDQQLSNVMAFLADGCKKIEMVVNEQGDSVKTAITDYKKVWYKGHLIPSTLFARFAFALEEFLNLSEEAFNNMSAPRAQNFANQILRKYTSYAYSIDAKSSETILDKNNRQGALVQALLKDKHEKVVTFKGEASKGFLESVGLKTKNDEAHN